MSNKRSTVLLNYISSAALVFLLFLQPIDISAQFFKTQVDSIYDFSPSRLTKSQQEKKMPALDAFWQKVKTDTTSFLPELRTELDAPGHHPFFYYDGAGLLLSLSPSMADKQLSARAMAKSDLDDIDRQSYVYTFSSFARDGIDVTGAAIRILADSAYSFIIAQHAMVFEQDYCLAYMLLPEKPGMYTDSLIALFGKANVTAQKSIITTFWLAYTCKGDSLIRAAAVNAALRPDIRKYAEDLMAHASLNDTDKEYIKIMGKEDPGGLRENALRRFSDEAIDELASAVRILRAKTGCR